MDFSTRAPANSGHVYLSQNIYGSNRRKLTTIKCLESPKNRTTPKSVSLTPELRNLQSVGRDTLTQLKECVTKFEHITRDFAKIEKTDVCYRDKAVDREAVSSTMPIILPRLKCDRVPVFESARLELKDEQDEQVESPMVSNNTECTVSAGDCTMVCDQDCPKGFEIPSSLPANELKSQGIAATSTQKPPPMLSHVPGSSQRPLEIDNEDEAGLSSSSDYDYFLASTSEKPILKPDSSEACGRFVHKQENFNRLAAEPHPITSDKSSRHVTPASLTSAPHSPQSVAKVYSESVGQPNCIEDQPTDVDSIGSGMYNSEMRTGHKYIDQNESTTDELVELVLHHGRDDQSISNTAAIPFSSLQRSVCLSAGNFGNVQEDNNIPIHRRATTSFSYERRKESRVEEQPSLSQINAAANRSIEWIFRVVPKPIIRGYANFCQSMVAKGNVGAVRSALNRLTNLGNQYKFGRASQTSSKCFASEFDLDDQASVNEALNQCLSKEHPMESDALSTQCSAQKYPDLKRAEKTENESSDINADEDVLREFYELIKLDNYSDHSTDYPKNPILKCMSVNKEEKANNIATEPTTFSSHIKGEKPFENASSRDVFDLTTEGEGVEENVTAVRRQAPMQKSLKRKLSMCSLDESDDSFETANEGDPESTRKRLERSLHNKLRKDINSIQALTKEGIIPLIERGVCSHDPQKLNVSVTCSNNICSADNYESSAVYHFQNPTSLYPNIERLPSAEATPANSGAMNTADSPCTSGRLNDQKANSLNKSGNNSQSVYEVSPTSETCNRLAEQASRPQCALEIASPAHIERTPVTLPEERPVIPEIDDDAFNFSDVDVEESEIYLDRCMHNSFLADLFEAGFQTLGARIVQNAEWKERTTVPSVHFFDGNSVKQLTYHTVLERIPSLAKSEAVLKQLQACNCIIDSERLHDNNMETQMLPGTPCKEHRMLEEVPRNKNARVDQHSESIEIIDLSPSLPSSADEPPDPEVTGITSMSSPSTANSDVIEGTSTTGSGPNTSCHAYLSGYRVWVDPYGRCDLSKLNKEVISLVQELGGTIERDPKLLNPEFNCMTEGIYLEGRGRREIWSYQEAYEYFSQLPLDLSSLSSWLKNYQSKKCMSISQGYRNDVGQVEVIDLFSSPRKVQRNNPIFSSIEEIWKRCKAYEQEWLQDALLEQERLISSLLEDHLNEKHQKNELQSAISSLSTEILSNQIQIASLKGQLAYGQRQLVSKEDELQFLLRRLEQEMESNHKKEEVILGLKDT